MWVNTKTLRDSLNEVVQKAMLEASQTIKEFASLKQLREQIETLTIEKNRREEDFSRREREVEHKVGLERKRQEFEISQAKRETSVTLREENLKADRARFEEQMKFHDERFSTEVGYLKDMVGQMLKRLPSTEIFLEKEITGRKP
jgi:hypothetical protein